jgi:hypothetical protein
MPNSLTQQVAKFVFTTAFERQELPNLLTVVGMILVIAGEIFAIYFGQSLIKNSK